MGKPSEFHLQFCEKLPENVFNKNKTKQQFKKEEAWTPRRMEVTLMCNENTLQGEIRP